VQAPLTANSPWQAGGRLLRSLALAAVTAMVLSPQVIADRWLCDTSPVLITDVAVWTDGGTEAHRNIFLKDGRIAWIGDEDRRPEASEYRTIDGRGMTALPGLIDSHTHFDTLGAAKSSVRSSDLTRDILPITLRQTLASGVTGARIHLTALDQIQHLLRAADSPCFPGPRLTLSGPGLLGGAPSVNGRLMRGIQGAADATEKIRQMHALGARWLALHRPAAFTGEEITAIKDEADRLGMSLLADADAFDNMRRALEIGVASGEYVNRTETPDYPEDIKQAITAQEPPFTVVAPIGYYHRVHRIAADRSFSLSPGDLAFVPDRLQEAMQAGFEAEFANDAYIASILASYPTMARKFKSLGDAGAVRLVGTDAGSLGQFHNDAVWWELKAHHAFGVSARDTVAAVTSRAAAFLAFGDAGTLSEGKRADIVLYAGELENGEFERRHVRDVIKGGILFLADYRWIGPDTQQTVDMLTKE